MTEDLVQLKTDLLKELYQLVISQAIIAFKENVWFGLTANSSWKSTYLDFTFDGIEFQIKRDVRIKETTLSKGIIGEERYSLGHPDGLRVAQIKMWTERINAHVKGIVFAPAIVSPTAADAVLKVCKTCKDPKATTEFSYHNSTKDNLYADCKECVAEKARDVRERKKRLERERKYTSPEPYIKVPAPTVTDDERQKNLKRLQQDNLKKFLNL